MAIRPHDPEIDTGLLPVRTTHRKGWPPYYFAKLMINTLAPHITSGVQYRKWIKETRSVFLPKNPERIYKDFSWNAFLNTDNLTPFEISAKVRVKNIKFRPMWEGIKFAQRYCTENGITNSDQWFKGYDKGDIPEDVPKYPHITYGKEFPGYGVWLGKKTIAKIDAEINVNSVLTLLHCAGESANVVNIKVWTEGLSDIRANWGKQGDYDKIYGQWKYERENMSRVMSFLNELGHERDGKWVIPNMNQLMWELNSLLLIVR